MLNARFVPIAFLRLFIRFSLLLVLLAGLLPATAWAQESTSSYVFGSQAVGASTTQTLTLSIPSGVTLGGIAVSTQGAPNRDFTNAGAGSCTVGTAYAANATCTVSVTYAPKLAGARYGGVVLTDNSGNVIATDLLQGMGTGPQVNFLPGTEITVDDTRLANPANLVVDGSGNVYLTGYAAADEVLKATWSGSGYTLTPVFGVLTGDVGGLAVDGAGNFYIALTNSIQKETWNGSSYVQSMIGSGLSNPNGIGVDGSGNLYIADVYNGRVVKETLSAGTYTQSTILTCGGGGQSCPSAAAVDGNGNVFVTAYDSSQIIELTPSGGYTQSTINASLTWPSSIVADGLGNLYIADTLDSRAVKMTLTPSGYVQSTVPSGAIDWPWGVAVDQFGNVYISDTYDERVLKEDLEDAPSLSFATTPVGGTSSDSPKTVQVFNFGNQALELTGLSYPADFPMASGDASACTGSSSLSSGQQCDLPIEFAPEKTGAPLSEDVTLTDNALNVAGAQQAVAVSGATTESIVATHLSVSAPANVGAGVPFTITVTALDASGGTATGYAGTVSFTSTDGSAMLPAASKLTAGVGTFQVTLKTQGDQTITATDAANSFTATSATIDVGATPPGVFPAQSSANFGSQPIGSPSGAQTLSFTIGAGTTVGSLAVVTQGAPNLDFTEATGSTCTAKAYASATTCTVDVTFKPEFAGERYGAVVFFSEAKNTGTVLGQALIYGIGAGPEVVFSPATVSTLGGGFNYPYGVAVDGSGNVYVADGEGSLGSGSVKEMPPGCASSSCVTTLGGGFHGPEAVAVDGRGNIYIADTYNDAVKEMPPGCASSSCVTTLGGGIATPISIAVDRSSNVYVAEWEGGAVKEIPPGCASSSCVTVLGGGFGIPTGVAVDGSGNVFVAANGFVKEMPQGCVSSSCVTTLLTQIGGLNAGASGIALDGGSNIYFTNYGNGDVYELPSGCASSSCVTTLGSGFGNPANLAVDGSGNVYIAAYCIPSNGCQAVKVIDRATPPALNFPTATPVGSVDTTDDTQTVQIQNIGSAALAFTGLSYPADFSEASGDASACTGSTSLSAGQECDLAIEFAPEKTGAPLSEDVTLTDNALNVTGAQQSVAVSGTSTGSIVATHLSLSAPANAGVGAAFSITVTALDASGGTATGYAGTVSFTSTDASAVLPAASTLTAGVGTFPVTLKTEGDQTITAADAANSFTATSGTIDVGATPPGVFPAQGSVNFGSQAIGSPSGAQTLSFSIGAGTTVGSIAVVTQGAANLDFTQATGSTCTATAYSSGATCVVNVIFTPKFAGIRYGAVVFGDGSGNVLATEYLLGTGTGPQVTFLPGTESTMGIGLSSPGQLAVDGSGNVYLTDNYSGRILKETSSGGGYTQSVILTCENVGVLNCPGAVAVDGAGNVYVGFDLISTTYDKSKILKMTPSASGYTLSTIGSGLTQAQGLVVDGNGNVFIADYISDGSTGRVVEEVLSADGTYTQSVVLTAGTGSFLGTPSAVAVDANGNLFVSSYYLSQLIELTPSSGGYTQSLIGSGLNWPDQMVTDGEGNLYIADGNNSRIVKETLMAGSYVQSTVSTSGTSHPWGVAVDQLGNVYASDTYNARLLKEDLADAPSLSFATTAVGSTSSDSPKTAQILNYGNEALALTALTYPVDFPAASGDASACTSSTSLSAGQECDLPIEFVPENAGSPLSEDVTLTDDALNVTGAQQSIAVSGTATSNTIPSHFSVTTTASVVAGTPFTITVTALLSNGGTASGYNGTVSFSSSDPLFVNPGPLTLTSGAGQTTVTLNTAGTQSITATDTTASTLTGSGSFSVAPAPPGPDTLYLPTPGSVLKGPEVTFTWTPLAGATGYSLWVGTAGVGSKDLYDWGEYPTTSRKVADLPTNGETVYVRLYTISGKVVVHSDYTYIATTRAAMISPAGGIVLGGTSQTFTWSASTGASGYSLWLSGTGPGLNDLFDSRETRGTSATANGLPSDGATIYARLYTTYGNITVYNDYTFTAQ